MTHMARYFDLSIKELAVIAFLDQAIGEYVVARRIIRQEVHLNDTAELLVDTMFVRIRMYELLRGKFAIQWYTIPSRASKRKEKVIHC